MEEVIYLILRRSVMKTIKSFFVFILLGLSVNSYATTTAKSQIVIGLDTLQVVSGSGLIAWDSEYSLIGDPGAGEVTKKAGEPFFCGIPIYSPSCNSVESFGASFRNNIAGTRVEQGVEIKSEAFADTGFAYSGAAFYQSFTVLENFGVPSIIFNIEFEIKQILQGAFANSEAQVSLGVENEQGSFDRDLFRMTNGEIFVRRQWDFGGSTGETQWASAGSGMYFFRFEQFGQRSVFNKGDRGKVVISTDVVSSVPEASSIYLLALGLLGLFGVARRKV